MALGTSQKDLRCLAGKGRKKIENTIKTVSDSKIV